MKTALIQLPVPDPASTYTRGNVPLAAGYLKAYAAARDQRAAEEIDIIPAELSDHGGDSAVVEWVLEHKYRLIGFTLYLWNIERSLLLARRIKEHDLSIAIVAGGPEVTPEIVVPADSPIDVWVAGEGERVFYELWRGGVKRGRIPLVDRSPLDLSTVSNPYLSGVLAPPLSGGIILFERMRGCPCRCSYCYYGKQYPVPRYFPRGMVVDLFDFARRCEDIEVYFMDPTFNSGDGVADYLKLVAICNPTGIPIHTEVRLERITPTIGALMRRAGIRSVEVGLQSVNKNALAAVGRQFDMRKFARGASILKEEGIEIRTGVILGLPCDTVDDFGRTIDFVASLGLTDTMELYPLAVLPGTTLRKRADELGLCFMKRPPYWTLSTPTMGMGDLIKAIALLEEKTGLEFHQPMAPHLQKKSGGFVSLLDLRGAKAAAAMRLALERSGELANVLTLLIDEKHLRRTAELEHFGDQLLRHNPHSLYQLVLRMDAKPDCDALSHVAEHFFNPGHHLNSLHHFDCAPQHRHSVRVFQVIADCALIKQYYDDPWPVDLVWQYTPGALRWAKGVLDKLPFLLMATGIPPRERKALRKSYHGHEERLIECDVFA